MPCKAIIDDKKNIVNVNSSDGFPSELFNMLKMELGNNSESNFTAYRIWAATQSVPFNAIYDGHKNAQGEPVLAFEQGQYLIRNLDGKILLSAHKNIKTIGNEAKYLKYSMLPPEVPISIPLTESERQIFDTNEELFKTIVERRISAFSVLEMAEKHKKQRDSDDHYILSDGTVASGVSFNGNFITQKLRQFHSKYVWQNALTFGENMAEMRFQGRAETLIETFPGSKQYVTKEEYAILRNKNADKASITGKLVHLYDQLNYVNDDVIAATAIHAEINALLSKAEAEGMKISKNRYQFIKINRENINKVQGIGERSIVVHEIPLISETFGTVALLDKMVIQPDGSIQIHELKTSSSLDSDGNGNIFKYGQKLSFLGIEDNKLNQAKIQAVMGAMALIDNVSGTKITGINIQNYSSERITASSAAGHPVTKEDLIGILAMLKRFFAEEKGPEFDRIRQNLSSMERADPEKYAKLFDWRTYSSRRDVSIRYVEEASGLTKEQLIIETVGEEVTLSAVERMRMALSYMPDLNHFRTLTKKSSATSKEKELYEDIEASFKDFWNLLSDHGADPSVFTRDISFLNMWVGGTMFNIRHPFAQPIVEYYQWALIEKNREHIKHKSKLYTYLLPAYNKWARTRGYNELTNFNDKHLGLFDKTGFFKEDIHEFWEQFYEGIEIDGNIKRRRRLSTDSSLGAEERMLLEHLDGYYKSWMDDTVPSDKNVFINNLGRYSKNFKDQMYTMTHAQVLLGSVKDGESLWKELTETTDSAGTKIELPFMPAVVMHESESRWKAIQKARENGSIEPDDSIGKRALAGLTEFFKMFMDRQIGKRAEEDQTLLIPIKYVERGGYDVATYSEDLLYQFELFTNNMLSKKHMEQPLAFGEAAIRFIETRNEEISKDSEKLKNLKTFLERQIRYNIKGEMPKDPLKDYREDSQKIFGIPIRLRAGNLDEDEIYFITIHSMLRGLRTTAAYAVMSLNVVGASFNAIQALFSTAKMGLSNQMAASKWMGIDTDIKDFNVSDLGASILDVLKMEETFLNGNPEKAKIHLIAQEIGWLPNDQVYLEQGERKLFRPYSILSPNKAMWFYTSVEELNSLAMLVMQLKAMKFKDANGNFVKNPKTGKDLNMYDAYEVETEENPDNKNKIMSLKYNGPSRGRRWHLGKFEDVGGLTEQDTIKLKRVYERIQGNYRPDERSLLEMWILGQSMMQFRRFLPSLIRGMFQSRQADPSLGYYVKNKEGILEWEPRMITGKYRLMTGFFFSAVVNPLYKKVDNITNNNLSKIGVRFDDSYKWEDMSHDERIQMMDGAITLILGMALYIGAALKHDKDGDDDPVYKILERVRMTVLQPWSIPQLLQTVKSYGLGVGVSLAWNEMHGWLELLNRLFLYSVGMEESVYNQSGNLPGMSKIISNMPYGKAYHEVDKLFYSDRN
jgi:hypothetical protein